MINTFLCDLWLFKYSCIVFLNCGFKSCKASLFLTIREDFAAGGLARGALEGFTVP